MAQTRIEWCDWSTNPVKGLCPVNCKDLDGKPYCYARRIYTRFHLDPAIWYDPTWELHLPKKPSRIFVGSTMELFGTWIPDFTVEDILKAVLYFPQHTFIFLTKRPWELKKYNPWPSNCWVGMSATNMSQIGDIPLMADVQAKVRFVSFEPLLDYTAPDLRYISWVIIGQQTPVRKDIPISWVHGIEKEADRQHIPIFEKNNLHSLIGPILRQEWPKVEVRQCTT